MGEGGTGKSTVIKTIEATFDPGEVCEIDAKCEGTFGFQDKFDKELVLISDAPMNMSRVLPQELFQKMVSGDKVQVSVKHQKAFMDNHGQISRRVVVFWFSRIITRVDAGLQERIERQELPQFVARCLGAYRALRERAGTAGYFEVCAPVLKEAQQASIVDAFLDGRNPTGGVGCLGGVPPTPLPPQEGSDTLHDR